MAVSCISFRGGADRQKENKDNKETEIMTIIYPSLIKFSSDPLSNSDYFVNPLCKHIYRPQKQNKNI